MKLQPAFTEYFHHHLSVKLIDKQNTNLTPKCFDVFYHFKCLCLMYGEFIFLHAKLLYHFYKCHHGKRVMLHGNGKFLFDRFLCHVFGLDQLILLYYLPGIPDKFLPVRRQANSTVRPPENLNPCLPLKLFY